MNEKRKKIITCILFAAGIFCITAYLWHTLGGAREGVVFASELQSGTEDQWLSEVAAKLDAENAIVLNTISANETDVYMKTANTPLPELTENPYSEYFLQNADMVAWLQIDGMKIDYPVMWTPGDEEYYLSRDFEGHSDSNGCLLLDTDSSLDPLTTNLIIHGHHMRSGAMFGKLEDYKDPQFAKEHDTILLYTENGIRTYEVLAVFYSQVYYQSDEVFKYYAFFQADTQEEFDDFYDNIMELSLYDTGVTAEFGDHFLTLSTCAYHVDYGRFVVVAKEVSYTECYLPIQER
ncbi:MAG: class B sortase [Lachnospiraceae bacterium]|nr:class B sortase [Lachnospiraceae bacterium]